jgi:protein-tyrosine phosphatase
VTKRCVELEGCHNFRDIGGYPTESGARVRTGLVYRSDALHHLTVADVARLREELCIEEIIDLRSTAELTTDGRGALASADLGFHHVPLFDGRLTRPESWSAVETLAERYALLADFAKGPIARVIQVVADATGPVVYHCAAGKDRTGVISGVLLGLLGVPDEVVVADYVATQEHLDAIIERLMSTEGYQKMLAALPPDTLHAEAETMARFLASIRERYGSMRGYAASAGLDASTLARLADRLVEA